LITSFQVQSAKTTREVKKKRAAKWKPKGEYTPFPPPQLPSKVDKQLETGEYFMLEQDRRKQKQAEKEAKQTERRNEKKQKRAAELVPPVEKKRLNKTVARDGEQTEELDLKRLKKKAEKQKKTKEVESD